jgi:hypothetical protein
MSVKQECVMLTADPSAAWRTASGEWRAITFDGRVWSSTDFVSWHPTPQAPNGFAIPHGECPSLFKLPRTTPGVPHHQPSPNVTHVSKISNGDWHDYMIVGTYRGKIIMFIASSFQVHGALVYFAKLKHIHVVRWCCKNCR